MNEDGREDGGVLKRLAVWISTWHEIAQGTLLLAAIAFVLYLLSLAGVELPRNRASGHAGAHDRRLLEAEKNLKKPERIQLK